MFKLLIVDDFFVERENAKDIIKESGLEIFVSGEVSNGLEALEAIEKEEPDFVLADIEMPIMNGLDLAVAVKRKYPQIKILFFSFYNKFEYAKKAIDLEAYAYILKPIEKDEMVDALKKMIKEKKQDLVKNEENSELKKIFEISKPILIDKFKRDLFLGFIRQSKEIWERVSYFKLCVIEGDYVVLIVEVDDYYNLTNHKNFEEKELISISITNNIKQILDGEEYCLWVRMDNSHWAFLLNRKDLSKGMEEYAWSLSETIINDLSVKGVNISVGISGIFYEITCICSAYEQAIHALDYKFNIGKGQIILFEDIRDNAGSITVGTEEIHKELMIVLNSGDKKMAENYVENLFAKIDKNSSENAVKNLCFGIVFCIQLILTGFNINFTSIFGEENLVWEKLMRFETIIDIRQWLKNVIISVIEYVESVNSSQFRRIIEDAKKIIEKNYNTGITVKSIADTLYYNPNYLNNLFKQEMGITMLEYITKVRVEEAKKLLKEDASIKMYELSVAVGYSHEAYFKNIFRQYTGLTPREFREKMK